MIPVHVRPIELAGMPGRRLAGDEARRAVSSRHGRLYRHRRGAGAAQGNKKMGVPVIAAAGSWKFRRMDFQLFSPPPSHSVSQPRSWRRGHGAMEVREFRFLPPSAWRI
ncbi:hypothetical protein GUJ93_ZPchr0007g3584 [Zizania palustris]|uniref:Uncharacterized protein n=1 Tax=Zizania palustris TaxID=103762 RepID=A0A8J5SVQ1_ZIZPA|nr:hypothetical protein GUJ93_ZPchr0007g3584 [Zizania palustris]